EVLRFAPLRAEKSNLHFAAPRTIDADDPEHFELRARTLRDGWIGALIDNYRLETVLGEGPYSWVFRGVRSDDDSKAAIKVAKPLEFAGTRPRSMSNPTEGLIFTTGGVNHVCPDPDQLLLVQSQRIRSAGDRLLVSAEPAAFVDSACCMRMEFIDGSTLREM